MARYTDPSCRLCREKDKSSFLKAKECYSTKCSMEKRSFPPGQHDRAEKVSEYGLQLREKQKQKILTDFRKHSFGTHSTKLQERPE